MKKLIVLPVLLFVSPPAFAFDYTLPALNLLYPRGKEYFNVGQTSQSATFSQLSNRSFRLKNINFENEEKKGKKPPVIRTSIVGDYDDNPDLYRTVYYPGYTGLWRDTDGDGIPNRYDSWPFNHEIWYGYKFNFIPDWYDPYYIDYYHYWSLWHLGFWVGYHWYTHNYYRDYYPYGYPSVAYYNDYSTYHRLYDHRYVNDSSNPRRYERLDVKLEANYRSKYRNTPHATSSAAGSRHRGYDSASRPNNRALPTAFSREREDG